LESSFSFQEVDESAQRRRCGGNFLRTLATPEVGTIGSTIRVGHEMVVHCENWKCLHRALIDLEALRDQLGEDYPIADFVARAKCSECDARWPALSISVHPIAAGRPTESARRRPPESGGGEG
jgi:hypothetical protein